MIKLDDGHVFPRDERKSMIIFKDWIINADYMSDQDFRAAIKAAVKYGTEGLTGEQVVDWIKSLDKNLYHIEIIMFWFLGIKGTIDKPYDEWQKKKNNFEKGKKKEDDLQP